MSEQRFYFVLKGGRASSATGTDIADAISRSKFSITELRELESYRTEESETIIVSGAAKCGCNYHAEQGLACDHDLELIGIRV